MRSYKNILNLFPFIGKDFYYYSHPDCNLFRLRNFNDEQIFCDLRCANISSGLSLNTSICDITFKKKTSLSSKQRTCYKDIYELSFYKHFIIEKIKVSISPIILMFTGHFLIHIIWGYNMGRKQKYIRNWKRTIKISKIFYWLPDFLCIMWYRNKIH